MNPHKVAGLFPILSEAKTLLAATDYPGALELIRVGLRRLETDLSVARRAEVLKFMGLIAESIGDITEAGTLYCTAQRIVIRGDDRSLLKSLEARLNDLAIAPKKYSMQLTGHPQDQQLTTRAALGWIDLFLGQAEGWAPMLAAVDHVSVEHPIYRWFVPELQRLGARRENFGEIVRQHVRQQALQNVLLEGNTPTDAS